MRTLCFFFSSRRRHTRLQGDWSSDVCSSDLSRKPEQSAAPSGSCPGAVRSAPPSRMPAPASGRPRGCRPPARQDCFLILLAAVVCTERAARGEVVGGPPRRGTGERGGGGRGGDRWGACSLKE